MMGVSEMSVRIDEPQRFVSMSNAEPEETTVAGNDETSSIGEERHDEQPDEALEDGRAARACYLKAHN
uniref:Uncharacterized protein n=1 Tax=Caenorhabditis tropicalis TaxID=1561998 RepID=A0A1I7TQZ2_9PELO